MNLEERPAGAAGELKWVGRAILRHDDRDIDVASIAGAVEVVYRGTPRTWQWSCELPCMQAVCPDPIQLDSVQHVYVAHMLRCKPIEVEPIVSTALSICNLLYT